MDPTPASRQAVDDAITSRRSVRAFLPTPVSRETVAEILRVAARAPSGTNYQPWRVHVLAGEAKAELGRNILSVFNDPEAMKSHSENYPYYPEEWISPYIERRRKIGWDMYGLLGIGKADRDKMAAQTARNYLFFDAPVGLIFTRDKIMREGSLLDYGTFIQNIMVAARGRGLDTCPQQAFTRFHRVIEDTLKLPANESIVCGMALGYADNESPINRLVTEREPVENFSTFRGF